MYRLVLIMCFKLGFKRHLKLFRNHTTVNGCQEKVAQLLLFIHGLSYKSFVSDLISIYIVYLTSKKLSNQNQ